MDRRQVLKTLGGATAVVWYGTAARAQQTTLRERRNINALAPAEIAALRQGVRLMKQRSLENAHDPRGWNYWYSIHRSTTHPPSHLASIYHQCDHSRPGYVAQHFLSWHRAYLHFFEQVLGDAVREATNAEAPFALPYWDWYADPGLPTAFTEGDETSNALKHRRTGNAGFASKDAFSQNSLLPVQGDEPSPGFSRVIEAAPHGAIHGNIGGDMGSVPTAARDPIFWLHHANIDRLWSAWLSQSGRVLPPATWDKTHRFDIEGQWVMQAASTFDTSTLQNPYRYTDESIPSIERRRPFAPATRRGGITRARVASEALQQLDVSDIQDVTVGAEAIELSLPLSTQQSGRLASLAADAPRSGANDLTGAWLVLENVAVTEAGREGGFNIEVLLLGSGEPISLANINTFSLSANAMTGDHHDHDASAPVTLILPIAADLADALGPQRLASSVRIGLEPDVTREGRDDALVSMSSTSIRVSNLLTE